MSTGEARWRRLDGQGFFVVVEVVLGWGRKCWHSKTVRISIYIYMYMYHIKVGEGGEKKIAYRQERIREGMVVCCAMFDPKRVAGPCDEGDQSRSPSTDGALVRPFEKEEV